MLSLLTQFSKKQAYIFFNKCNCGSLSCTAINVTLKFKIHCFPMNTKVQYCGLSKYLDRMSLVWELIFWYFIDIWFLGDNSMIISRNHFHHNVHVKYLTIIIIWDYHDSCSIMFSCKFCNCRHQRRNNIMIYHRLYHRGKKKFLLN